jgi:hypothetical protein
MVMSSSRHADGSSRWRPTASPVNKMELPLNSSFMTMLTAFSFSEPDRPDQSGWGWPKPQRKVKFPSA